MTYDVETPFPTPRHAASAREAISTNFMVKAVRAYPSAAVRLADQVGPGFAHVVDMIDIAPLWYAAPDMVPLIEHAARTLPKDTKLTEDLFPPGRRGGMLLLGQPTVSPNSYDPSIKVYEDVIIWHPNVITETKRMLLRVDGFCYATPTRAALHGTLDHSGGSEWLYTGSAKWFVGSSLDEVKADTDSGGTVDEAFRFLLAFLAIVDSPGITETTTRQPTRTERRRAVRNDRDPSDINIVTLRRRHGEPEHETTSEGRQYNHRWIVDGHWRNQAHGPGRTLRKPVWIAPHIKGPDDAPMKDGEKIRALLR